MNNEPQEKDLSEVLSDLMRRKMVDEDGFIIPSFEYDIYLKKSFVNDGLTKARVNDLLRDVEARTEKNYNILMHIDILQAIGNVIKVEVNVLSYGLRD